MPNYRLLRNADLKGKRVLVRAGFDVPIDDGKVSDTARIEAMLPTINLILEKGASLIIMAHQGRPKDAPDPEFTQKPVAEALGSLLGKPVQFAEDCIGARTEEMAAALKPGDVLLLENLRFHSGEKKNNPEFAAALVRLAEVYVNDAFTNCHRKHASMIGVPALLPSFMGLQLEEEVKHLSVLIENPKKPVTLIISGVKMETKVPVIERFLSHGDHILLGGGIANTFMAAQGHDIGASRYEAEFVPKAQEILAQSAQRGNATVHVPSDVVIANSTEATESRTVSVDAIGEGMAVFDVGTKSLAEYLGIIESSSTIVWNGPLGYSENELFAKASKLVAAAVAKATQRGATTIIGGGDTLDFHHRYNLPLSAYTFASTAGGAMLEFISGVPFTALEALCDS